MNEDAAPPHDELPIDLGIHTIPLPTQKGEIKVRSLERHACPHCGGKAIWNAAQRVLECPYCGTHFERESDDLPPIIEHDLLKSLAEHGKTPEDWEEPEFRLVKCSSCHGTLQRSKDDVAQNCDFCGAPELLDYEDIEAKIRPESLLPASIGKPEANQLLRDWLSKRWLAPNDLKQRSLIDKIHGVYIPYWTFDAAAHCPWTAESGTYYYVTVRYRDSQGNSRTRRERRIRWRPASGIVNTHFDDITVAGSNSIDPTLLRKIEPFPTKDLVPYETRYISGWHVEHYQIDLPDAAKLSQAQMHSMLQSMCGEQVPGDTYRHLKIFPEFSERTYKHILVPLWIVAYRYRGKHFQSIVNGYTGKVAATYPKSAWKITLLTLLILALLSGIVYWIRIS